MGGLSGARHWASRRLATARAGSPAHAGRAAVAAFALTLALGAPAFAQASLLNAAGRPDYANPATWLCRPDLADNRCKVDLDATAIAAGGRMTIEPGLWPTGRVS